MDAPSSGLCGSQSTVTQSTVATGGPHRMPEYAMDSSSDGATSDASDAEDTWELYRRPSCPADVTRRGPAHGLAFEQEVFFEDTVAEKACDFELQALEAKLELVSIKRRLSAIKCQKFLDELEASQKPSKTRFPTFLSQTQIQSHDRLQGDPQRRFKRHHSARARYTSSHQRCTVGSSEQCQKADCMPEHSPRTSSTLLVDNQGSRCTDAAHKYAQPPSTSEQPLKLNSSQHKQSCEDLIGGSMPSLSPKGRRSARSLPSMSIPDAEAEAYYQKTRRASKSARGSPRGQNGTSARKILSCQV